MLARIVLSVLVAVFVTLGCILVGGILATLGVPIAATVGGFLGAYATALGVLAGLYHFFSGGFSFPRAP